MDLRFLVIPVVLLLLLKCCPALEDSDMQSCRGKEELPKVDISEHCSKEYRVDYAVNIIPTTLSFSVLKNCLNCSLVLRARESDQLTATFFSLGTETSGSGECTDNRLDIYDGDKIAAENRMSNDSGICGCNLPKNKAYKTKHNSILVHFSTKCENETQHGEFELVVSAIINENFNKSECHGQFECTDGHCVDKNLICDGKNNCPDGSDEQNCTSANKTCAGRFECRNGDCIDKNLVCNGKSDCVDRSDEVNCTHHGGRCPGKFECTDGQCINKSLVCNGKNDCRDRSDEKGCKTRPSTTLLYVLIGVAGLVLVMFVVIVILLCYRYCCNEWRVAAAYRRI